MFDPNDPNNWKVLQGTGTGTGIGQQMINYPPTVVTYPNTNRSIQDLMRSLESGNYRDTTPLAQVFPVGSNFMCLRGSYSIHAQGVVYTLSDILQACKHVRYMLANSEVIITKAVWDALFIYIQNDAAYAGLHPSEFLDKMFSPKESSAEI